MRHRIGQTPAATATYYQLQLRTLANMHNRRTGPDYRKHGGRIVYDINELDAWSSATRRRSERNVVAAEGTAP